MTLLATFHHSHQINNFSVPRPPPRRRSQPVRPPKSPHTQPANFPLQPGRWGAGPHHEKPKIKGGGRKEKRRGGGQLSRNGQEGYSRVGAGNAGA